MGRRWIVLTALFTLFLLWILVLAYTGRIPGAVVAIPFYDTLGHFFLIGGAAYLAHRATGRASVTLLGRSLPLGPLIVAILALGEEGLQIFSSQRTLSATDAAADLAGIATAIVLDRRLLLRLARRER